RGEEKEEDIEEKLKKTRKKDKKAGGKKNKEPYPQKRLVSKPLMDTLWTTFKLNKCLTRRKSLLLAFEFSMTERQINQWFFKKRKKYNREMDKQKYKKIQKR
ncbi:NANOG neighbor homeobox, partial [Phacochoerus africanus]|uniref:NANOG neighbor homeobox n=1 Tax=Phacochoerus africanus TaxID=41426 RepID=UPI001FD962EB